MAGEVPILLVCSDALSSKDKCSGDWSRAEGDRAGVPRPAGPATLHTALPSPDVRQLSNIRGGVCGVLCVCVCAVCV